MAVKYRCPKCEKRFIQWGAEKLKFKCPECKDEALVPLGSNEPGGAAVRPSLKRRTKKAIAVEAAPAAAGGYGDDDDPNGDVDEFGDVAVGAPDDFTDEDTVVPVEADAPGFPVAAGEEDAPVEIFDGEIDPSDLAVDPGEADEEVS